MRSLLMRIFLSFWLMIGITIGAAAIGGYWYAERARAAFENIQLGDSLVDASMALETGGKAGLARWLENQPKNTANLILVLDRHGKDILGRRVPSYVKGMVDRHRHHQAPGDRRRAEPRNLRWARSLTQLVSADGEVFTIIVAPPRAPPFFWNSLPIRSLMIALALFVSAFVSYLLARAITNPVRKLRDATVSLAGGNLDERVGPSLGSRRDELGRLARDFDAMAEKLQKSASQQTELARNISHELRSPLARMRVALELARQKSGESADLERIDNEIARLDDLIGQILKFSRLDSGEASAATRFDLLELIDEVVENVGYECRTLDGTAISVTSSVTGPVALLGHREAMISAIENILRNAVHHSPRASEVNVSIDQDDAHHLVIEIADSGSGVDDSELPKLFDAFFRTRKSAEDGHAHGTGLGLAIAARAVARNRGTISARNAAGGGLVITVSLPFDVNPDQV